MAVLAPFPSRRKAELSRNLVKSIFIELISYRDCAYDHFLRLKL